MENLGETVKSCEAEAVKVLAYACDVTNAEQVKNTVQKIEKDFGKIDTLVNNAGGVSTRPFHMEKLETFFHQIDLNFKAVRYSISAKLSLGYHVYILCSPRDAQA